MLAVSDVSFAFVLLLKFVFLHHANIIVEARADIAVTKLRPRESDISLICLDAPLGDCFVLWHAGDSAKLFVDQFRGFGVLTPLISYSPWALLSPLQQCKHYLPDCSGQSVVFVSKLNTS